ncbi:MAG: hypothetical protein ACO34J_03125 [Prochlorothrix sp.]
MTQDDRIPPSPSSPPAQASTSPTGQPRKRLGEFLVEAGFVTPSHIEVALLDQGVTGHRIGEIMVLRGWVDQPTVETIVQLQQEGKTSADIKPSPAEVVSPHAPTPAKSQVVLGSLEQLDVETVTMNLDGLKQQMAEEEARSAQNYP